MSYGNCGMKTRLTPPIIPGTHNPKAALDEPVLDDGYKVYGDYLYVADGKVIRSDVFGTVRDLKRATGAKEIRRCDMSGRDFF
jgi:hypothetical protein